MPFPFAAALGAIGSIAGGLLGRSGQREANRTNLQIWREQQQWEENLSNTSIARRKADLERSGFNPMLAMTDGASTPATGMPTMQNEEEEMSKGVATAAQAALVAQQMKIARVQAESLDRSSRGGAMVDQATARKVNAEAAITEQQVNSGMVGNQSFNLRRMAQKLGAEIDNITEDTASKMNYNWIMDNYGKDIQKYAEEAARLDLSEKRAVADLYEHFKGAKGAEKFMPVVLEIVRRVFSGK